MKNIHVLPTDKPSNLLLCIKDYLEHKDTPAENSDTKGNFRLGLGIYANTEVYQYQNIYIISDEEIKEGDWCMSLCDDESYEEIYQCNIGLVDEEDKKIVLTTDQDLIKNGVQSIDDEFLEWFVKNPTCEEVDVNKSYGGTYYITYPYKIIIPKEEPKTDEWLSPMQKFSIRKEEPKQEIIMEKTIQKLEQELNVKKLQQKQKENIEIETKVLKKLNTLVGKCYMKNCQSNQKLFYKFLSIKHKTKSQAGNTLLEVCLSLDKVIHCQIAEKNFNRGSTVSHHFQDGKYMDLEIQRFTLHYNKENGVFDFNRSVSNFMLFLTEISEEQYQSFLNLAIENENKSEELIKKYNIK